MKRIPEVCVQDELLKQQAKPLGCTADSAHLGVSRAMTREME
jgi:hypothetical protein